MKKALLIVVLVTTGICLDKIELYAQTIPRSAEEFYLRGNEYLHRNELDKALADYSEAIRLDPEHVNAYYNRANCYGFNKEYDKAFNDFNQVVRLAPDFAGGYAGRGYANHFKNNINRAIADYEVALQIDPNDTDIMALLEQARKDRLQSYFVKADGSDQNDGLTEKTAFKTLQKAIYAVTAKNSAIKTITIVGTLNPVSEGYSDPTPYEVVVSHIPVNGVFVIGADDHGREWHDEIKIIGKNNTSTLSGGNNKKAVVLAVGFSAKVRLENITISNGGCGLVLYGGTVYIGDKVTIENNSNISSEIIGQSPDKFNNFIHVNAGGGIAVTNGGKLIFDGADCEIKGNKAFFGGGIYLHNGSISMTGYDVYEVGPHPFNQSEKMATIRNGITRISENHSIYGGGVYIDGGTFTQNAGDISDNRADEFGGGVFVINRGRFIKKAVERQELSYQVLDPSENNGISQRNFIPNENVVFNNFAKEGRDLYVSRGKQTFKRDVDLQRGHEYLDSETGPWK